jgi:hypothetical protein
MSFLQNIILNITDIKTRILEAETPDQRNDLKEELDALAMNIYNADCIAEKLKQDVKKSRQIRQTRERLDRIRRRKNLRKSIIN